MQINIGYRSGKVIFTSIVAKSPVFSWYPSSRKNPEEWQDWVDKKAAEAPEGMRGIV